MGSKETDEVAAAGRQPELYPPPVDYPTIRSARGGGAWGFRDLLLWHRQLGW